MEESQMKGGEGREGGAGRYVLGLSPFGPALERALCKSKSRSSSLPASYWGQYLRGFSPRPIEREQQLLSEST